MLQKALIPSKYPRFMQVGHLTATDLRKIHLIYERQCGRELNFEQRMGMTPEELLKKIKTTRPSGSCELGAGARWSHSSKLVVNVGHQGDVEFVFAPEVKQEENERAYRGASRGAISFEARIGSYFIFF